MESRLYRSALIDWADRSSSSAKVIVPIIKEVLDPQSVVDIGCGVGTWLAAFQEVGVNDFLGVDGDYVDRRALRISEERFAAADLTEPYRVNRRFDLALSLEVGEHLPKRAARTFVQTLVDLAPAVLFSAAVPGQRRLHHVNEQRPRYWADLFAQHGYQPIDVVRPLVWENASVEWWYRQNVLLYLDETHYGTLGDGRTADAVRPVIHPEMHARPIRPLTLGELLRALPSAFGSSVRYRTAPALRRLRGPN